MSEIFPGETPAPLRIARLAAMRSRWTRGAGSACPGGIIVSQGSQLGLAICLRIPANQKGPSNHSLASANCARGSPSQPRAPLHNSKTRVPGPSAATTSSGRVPNSICIRPITLAARRRRVPRQPQWIAATACCFISARRIGTQSAV